MTQDGLSLLFSKETIDKLFPEKLADQFFEALYGDPSDGAYDIKLVFKEEKGNSLIFEFHLTQRPGKCLRCNLTYGLPQVFERHPVINLKGLVQKIDDLLGGQRKCVAWKLCRTEEVSNALHVIPLILKLDETE